MRMSQAKNEVIKRFEKLVCDLGIGKSVDYCDILQLLNFIQISDYLPNSEYLEICLTA